MRKLAFLIMTMAAAVSILAPSNASADTYGPYTYTIADGKAIITDFSSSYAGALAITNELGDRSVTAIGSYAFENCTCLSAGRSPAAPFSTLRRARAPMALAPFAGTAQALDDTRRLPPYAKD